MSSSRPAIGVTTSMEDMTSGEWTELTVGAPASYTRAIQAAGGRAVLLVPDTDAGDALDGIDALVVTGAAGDTDPSLYGAEAHPQTKPLNPDRDRFELAVTRTALDRGLPVLGVCRGMHVVNVACEGTLEQHVPDVVGHEGHTGSPGVFAEHDVHLEHGSLAARAVGAGEAHVRSYHHQGVGDLGRGLRATGWSTGDELVEAIEAPDGWVLGVLWHPEEDPDSQVIAALVRAAAT